jgi:hypothetical protein
MKRRDILFSANAIRGNGRKGDKLPHRLADIADIPK